MFREILVNIENKYGNIFNNGIFYGSPWNDINGYIRTIKLLWILQSYQYLFKDINFSVELK